jgi:hypothetical protein
MANIFGGIGNRYALAQPSGGAPGGGGPGVVGGVSPIGGGPGGFPGIYPGMGPGQGGMAGILDDMKRRGLQAPQVVSWDGPSKFIY